MKSNQDSHPEPPAGARDLSIPIPKAYLYMLVLFVPLLPLMILGHIAIWGPGNFFEGLSAFLNLIYLIPVLVIGVPLHEFIHGFTWVLFGGKPLSDIKFGFQWKSLAPYAHLKVPVTANAYRAGAVMPALLQGVLPYILGLVNGWGWFTALGIFFIVAAGGDLVVLWILRKVNGGALVEDHPTQAGCYVYTN
jgi:hypothetical protein